MRPCRAHGRRLHRRGGWRAGRCCAERAMKAQWPDLALAGRWARRELRGGLRGFRIFLACLALGTAVIAGVGSLAAAIGAGLKTDARALLGGDVELHLVHRQATPEQLLYLERS